MSAGALTVTIDTVGPVLTGKAPAANAMGISQTGNITASFNEAISGLSGASFTLKNNLGAAVAGAVSWNAATRVATMNPTATLAADKRHTAALTTAIKDLAGNPLVPATWAITTGPRPVVTARTPGVNAAGVSRVAMSPRPSVRPSAASPAEPSLSETPPPGHSLALQ
ncbi:Ig-like domain-containing protein [Arthrobacter sp. ISL-65]|nr:Ig-like domain-containing protein [Arthrobacter sp. ISL-65]